MLSDERIDAIAQSMPQGFLWSEECDWESGILIQEARDFARAIAAEVTQPAQEAKREANCEASQEPVAWMHENSEKTVRFLEWSEYAYGYRGEWIKTPLYAAPAPANAERQHSRDEELLKQCEEALNAARGAISVFDCAREIVDTALAALKGLK